MHASTRLFRLAPSQLRAQTIRHAAPRVATPIYSRYQYSTASQPVSSETRGFSTSVGSFAPPGESKSTGGKVEKSPVHEHEDAAPTDSEAAAHAEKHAEDPLEGQKKATGKADNKATQSKRSFSTSARSANEHAPQHLDKSGHEHLDKPSVSEETVHADKHAKDPLPDHKKASKSSGGKVVDSDKGPVQPEDEILTGDKK